jgi:hypothetical protein
VYGGGEGVLCVCGEGGDGGLDGVRHTHTHIYIYIHIHIYIQPNTDTDLDTHTKQSVSWRLTRCRAWR